MTTEQDQKRGSKKRKQGKKKKTKNDVNRDKENS